ncbi:asparagine synthase [Thermoascus aurantiacus ATCC 26904]
MCGIFFSLSSSGPVFPHVDTVTWLRSRGPDSFQIHTTRLDGLQQTVDPSGEPKSTSLHLTFISTVLALRGDRLQSQPLVDADSKSVLCWNGEAWKIAGEPVPGNDTEHIFNLFLESARTSAVKEDQESAHSHEPSDDSIGKLAKLISSISGPFSFVFYDGFNSKLYFSRDCLGRRSLLQGADEEGTLRICSVCDGASVSYEEVNTDGLHMIDLVHISRPDVHNPVITNGAVKTAPYCITTIPWASDDTSNPPSRCLRNPIPPMNRSVPEGEPAILGLDSPVLQTLEQKLRESLALRIQNVPDPPNFAPERGAKVAVLFSGGVDCTLLARLAHEILPLNETIDLLNVAFENPRVAAASAANGTKGSSSVYESCPDRITGRAGHAELQKVCPNRVWRFVAINVPYQETLVHRDEVKSLMRPHNTEMDLSIACALYFAARGQGLISPNVDIPWMVPYTTPARVLLSGLGADEVFAGYTRHHVAYTRHGFKGLIDEINLDVRRLGKRNLGRDDRIISHWGREARYPYLDEEFLAWALQVPVWEKCGFGAPGSLDVPSTPATPIEPGKRALRLVAYKLGMKNVAREKKRAIQFGSRTAKMESGRTKGTHVLS